MTDLLFYDTEATDADRRYGQITQFAALRTADDFTEIERSDIRVRLLPWVVPTPGAMSVTGLSCQDLLSPDRMSEYDAARAISKVMEAPKGSARVYVTYFGLGFDDELIRRTLYRNLQYPYPMSGKDRFRVDMLNVVRLAHHLQPDSVVAPWDVERERVSWRLEHVCPANGIDLRAHDGLEDAIALSRLTRTVRKRASWAWDAALRAGNPANVDAMIAEAAKGEEPIFLFTHFGEPDVVPCFPLATNGKRKHVLVDLRTDEYPADIDAARLRVNKAGTPFPIIRSNLSPIFVDHEIASAAHDFDLHSLSEKVRSIKEDSAVADIARQLVQDEEFARKGPVTSEDRIYDGFYDWHDSNKMKKFHECRSWVERADFFFEDARLKDFAARIVLDAAYNGDAVLDDDVRIMLEARCHEALSRPMAGADAPWATVEAVLAADPPDEWIDWARRHFCLDEDWGDAQDSEAEWEGQGELSI